MHSSRVFSSRPLPTAEAVEQLVHSIRSDRKVRPVVTPSGQRARGHFPSIKGKQSRYESLVEDDALRIAEVAATVLAVRTHPWVLDLRDSTTQRQFRYTPDLFLKLLRTATLGEVKGDWLLRKPSSRANLARTLRALRAAGIPMIVLSETDVRPAGLQQELKELLRVRPVGGRRSERIDSSLWDPLGRTQPSADLLRRWRAAQRECDELLERVMRRDPDEVIETLAA